MKKPVNGIERCKRAFAQAQKRALREGSSLSEANVKGQQAYRRAMPDFTTREGIRDYVGAVAFGMTIGAIRGQEVSKMLYAAQVALSATGKGKA